MTKSYQRGNQKPSIEGQTIQWPKDIKGLFRSRKSKDRLCNGIGLEDTKGVIRSRQSKKERLYNGQKIPKG